MKTLNEIITIIAAHKSELMSMYKIKSIGVFGSYVRNEQTPQSDVDILVDFEEGATVSLFKLVDIENRLGGYLGAKVDLVLKRSLKPVISQYINNEVVYL